jgi:hypothetical protein
MVNSVAIALAAVTAATFINSLGFILMKLALIKAETDKSRYFFLRPQYLVGFSFLILGALVAVGKLNNLC